MSAHSLVPRSDWYLPKGSDHLRCSDIAHEAFKLAVEKFSITFRNDGKQKDVAAHLGSIQDLRDVVKGAVDKYSADHDKPLRKWITRFSTRVMYYGNIMDVLSQHHPEYVSLAWGTMKFMFVAVINHGKLLATLTKGLTHVADALPRLELTVVLYPTERMKESVSEIYAIIVRFLIRAKDWLDEGKLMRAVHSVLRPSELYYDDLLEELQVATQNATNIAIAAAQAEQRDMHLTLLEVKKLITTHQQLNAAAQLNTNRALSDLQFSQILTHITNIPLETPEKCLQLAALDRKRRLRKTRAPFGAFWTTPQFMAWNHGTVSSLIMIRGNFMSRDLVKSFLVDAVECSRSSDVPVIWALRYPGMVESRLSTVELLKYLTSQALKQCAEPTEGSLALSCSRYQRSSTENDWVKLLADSLSGFRCIYILVDVELLHPDLESLSKEFSLPHALLALFRELSERRVQTIVKVALASYGSVMFDGFGNQEARSFIIPVRAGKRGVVPTQVPGRSKVLRTGRLRKGQA